MEFTRFRERRDMILFNQSFFRDITRLPFKERKRVRQLAGGMNDLLLQAEQCLRDIKWQGHHINKLTDLKRRWQGEY